jgi:hypothetical protein
MPRPSSSARAPSIPFRSTRSCRSSTGDRSSARGNCTGATPTSCRTRSSGARRRSCFRTRRPCSPASWRRNGLHREGRAGLLARQRRRRQHRGLRRRGRAPACWRVPLPAPATRKAGRPVQPLPRRLRRADRFRPPRLLGGFAVTAGHGVEQLAAELQGRHDDYSAIMAQALGDRLAEALAELMHQRARQFCGFGRARISPCRS